MNENDYLFRISNERRTSSGCESSAPLQCRYNVIGCSICVAVSSDAAFNFQPSFPYIFSFSTFTFWKTFLPIKYQEFLNYSKSVYQLMWPKPIVCLIYTNTSFCRRQCIVTYIYLLTIYSIICI